MARGRKTRRRCLEAHAGTVERAEPLYIERYNGVRRVETWHAIGLLLSVRPRMRHYAGNARLMPVLFDALTTPRLGHALFRDQRHHRYAACFMDVDVVKAQFDTHLPVLEQQADQERSASPFTVGTAML